MNWRWVLWQGWVRWGILWWEVKGDVLRWSPSYGPRCLDRGLLTHTQPKLALQLECIPSLPMWCGSFTPINHKGYGLGWELFGTWARLIIESQSEGIWLMRSPWPVRVQCQRSAAYRQANPRFLSSYLLVEAQVISPMVNLVGSDISLGKGLVLFSSCQRLLD